jgi:hypothetical protein
MFDDADIPANICDEDKYVALAPPPLPKKKPPSPIMRPPSPPIIEEPPAPVVVEVKESDLIVDRMMKEIDDNLLSEIQIANAPPPPPPPPVDIRFIQFDNKKTKPITLPKH